MHKRFIVLNTEDIETALNNREQAKLANFCTRIAMERVKRTKTPGPEYVVVDKNSFFASVLDSMKIVNTLLRKKAEEIEGEGEEKL